MANSLSDWLADKVASCIASCEVGRSADQQDRQSLLGDITYVKGLQVQILHFFTPRIAQQAHHELLESYHRGLGSQSIVADSGDGETADSGPLCAIVADKVHCVHVQISRHCVARFNRGSLMQIRSFRPSISFLPSLLDIIQRRDGPFAPQPTAIRPVLLLEVESMQVVGAINEVQFWRVKELQPHLLDKDTSVTPFKHWFKKVENIMRKEQQRRLGRLPGEAMGQDASQESKERSAKSSSESDTLSVGPASVSMPPPFQRPVQQNGPQHQRPSQQSASTSSQKSKPRSVRGSWGDFVLTQGDDEFGLEAAASQFIERHEQGFGYVEGQLTADTPDTDALFPSLPVSGFLSEMSGPSRDVLSDSGQKESDPSQSIKEEPSQSSTIPATYPSTSLPQEGLATSADTASQLESDFITPPVVTESTSLPFSLANLPSYPSTDGGLRSVEGSQSGPLDVGSLAHQASGEASPTVYTLPVPLGSTKRDSAAQTTLYKEVSMATDPIEDAGMGTDLIEQKRPFLLQLRGLPTATDLKEREPSFSSRIDLIID